MVIGLENWSRHGPSDFQFHDPSDHRKLLSAAASPLLRTGIWNIYFDRCAGGGGRNALGFLNKGFLTAIRTESKTRACGSCSSFSPS